MTDQIKVKLGLVLITLIVILLAGRPAPAQKPELVIQTGHQDTVRALAISPDGKLLASAGADKAVILWDMATGRQLFSFKGHLGWIFSLTFSPDGKFLASASPVGAARLWNIAEGRQEQEISLHPYSVTFVAFSADGKLLAISGTDKIIHLWDTTTRKMKTELRGHTANITQMAFSPHGKYLASSSMDTTLRIWDLTTGKHEFQTTYKEKDSLLFRIGEFKNPVEVVRKLRYDRDKIFNYIRSQLSAGTIKLLKEYDGSIPISDALQNALIDELNKLLRGESLYGDQRFAGVNIENETKRLLAKNPKGEELIRLNRLLLERTFSFAIAESDEKGITSLAYNSDGNLIAFATADNNISYWDLRTKKR